MIEEECSDSNHPGESANISNNITMVLVEFSLKEETLVVLDEVHETRDGENSGDAHNGEEQEKRSAIPLRNTDTRNILM